MSTSRTERTTILVAALLVTFLAAGLTVHAAVWNVVWQQYYSNPTAYNTGTGTAVVGSYVYDIGYSILNKDLSAGEDDTYRVEKRNVSDGTPVWGVTVNPTSHLDDAFAIAADANGVYVGVSQGGASGSSATSDSSWRVEARNPSNGSVKWVQVVNPTTNDDYPTSMWVSGNYLYVLGVQNVSRSVAGGWAWRLEKRDISNGALAWVKVYSSSDTYYPTGVVVSGSDIYTTGGAMPVSGASIKCVIEQRNVSDGSRNWVQYYEPTGDDICNGASVKNGILYVQGASGVAPGDAFVQSRDTLTGNLLHNVVVSGAGFDPFGPNIFNVNTYLFSVNGSKGIQQRDPNTLAKISGTDLSQDIISSHDTTALYAISGGWGVYTNGWTVQKVLLPPPPPPTIDTFSAQTNPVTPGTQPVLSWGTSNTTNCTLNGASVSTSGTNQPQAAITTGTTYTLNCTGLSGTVSQTLTVNVTPTIDTFSAQTNPVTPGTQPVLSWSTSNTASCTLNGASVGTSGANQPQAAITTDTPYVLNCTGPGGSVSKTLTVGVLACSISAAPTSVAPGGSVILTYSTSHAVAASVDQGVGSVPPAASPTSKDVTAPSTPGTYTYTMTVTNGSVSNTCQTATPVTVATVCTATPSAATLTASPTRVRANTTPTITFNWTLSNYEAVKNPGCYIVKNGNVADTVGARLGSASSDTVPATASTCGSANGTRSDISAITNQTTYSIACNGSPMPNTTVVVNVSTAFNEF